MVPIRDHYQNRSALVRYSANIGALWLGGMTAFCAATLLLGMPLSACSAPRAVKWDRVETPQQPASEQTTLLQLNLNGTQITLKTLDITPETPVTVDGKARLYKDLTADQQQQIQQAIATTRAATTNITPGTTQNTKILLNINGTKVELKTFTPTPDTSLTWDGRAMRFGDLTQEQQQQIRQSLAVAHVARRNAMPGVLGQVETTLNSTTLPQSVKTQVLQQVRQAFIDLDLGNEQARVYGNKLMPDTLVVIRGKQCKFKNLPVGQQKRIVSAWTRTGHTVQL